MLYFKLNYKYLPVTLPSRILHTKHVIIFRALSSILEMLSFWVHIAPAQTIPLKSLQCPEAILRNSVSSVVAMVDLLYFAID